MQDEYLEVLDRLGLPETLRHRFAECLDKRKTVTHVRHVPRFRICRDPDDDMLLNVAQTGRARFLITNDLDLLEISKDSRIFFRFEILTPSEFMSQWKKGKI